MKISFFRIGMTNKNVLLQRAEEQFLRKEYSNALKMYGILLKDHPSLKDAVVGAYLSDMGLDLEDDAQALFDYYQAIKDSSDDAQEIIDSLSQTIYATRFIVQEQIDGIVHQQAQLQDGIHYEEFTKLVEQSGDFRQVFENIMFSTKVIITKKDDFIDFVKRLIDADYSDLALKYLDAFAGSFVENQDIYALYKLIDKE